MTNAGQHAGVMPCTSCSRPDHRSGSAGQIPHPHRHHRTRTRPAGRDSPRPLRLNSHQDHAEPISYTTPPTQPCLVLVEMLLDLARPGHRSGRSGRRSPRPCCSPAARWRRSLSPGLSTARRAGRRGSARSAPAVMPTRPLERRADLGPGQPPPRARLGRLTQGLSNRPYHTGRSSIDLRLGVQSGRRRVVSRRRAVSPEAGSSWARVRRRGAGPSSSTSVSAVRR